MDVAFGVAEGPADEQGGAVADVAGDDGFGKCGLAEVLEGGVDGVAEVDAGVDEGAVEIEDEEARRDRHGLLRSGGVLLYWGGVSGQACWRMSQRQSGGLAKQR